MGRRKKKGDTIDVKVARTGSKLVEITLDGGRTVADALQAAGLSKKESEEVQVNGEDVDDNLDYELEDGDRVVLIKNIEGAK